MVDIPYHHITPRRSRESNSTSSNLIRYSSVRLRFGEGNHYEERCCIDIKPSPSLPTIAAIVSEKVNQLRRQKRLPGRSSPSSRCLRTEPCSSRCRDSSDRCKSEYNRIKLQKLFDSTRICPSMTVQQDSPSSTSPIFDSSLSRRY